MTNYEAVVPVLAATNGPSPVALTVTVAAFLGALIVALRLRNAPAPLRVKPSFSGSTPSGTTDLVRRTATLERALLVLLVGYILFDRPFAWIHVPGTPLFIGEMVIALGIAVVLSTKTRVNYLARSSSSLRLLRSWMLWGAMLLALGILPYGLFAVRDSAIWYYGSIAFFVVILLVSDPRRVNSWTDAFARLVPIYLLWFPFAIVLHRVVGDAIFVPDSEVPIFFHRSGNMAVMAAIAIAFMWMADNDGTIFPPRRRAWLTALATLVIVFTGLQNRGGLVAAACLIVALMFLLSKRRSEMVLMMVGIVVAAASIGLVFDVKIELFDSRDISVEQFTKNITSIFDREAGGQRQTETTAWRLKIWEQVLDDVTNESPIMGFGMGFDVGERYGIATSDRHPLRNPHNSHVGVLARMGWVGIILWAMLWIIWMAEMQTLRRRLRRRERTREYGLASFLMLTPIPILMNAIFDPTLEGAQVAMLLWALFGAGVAMVILFRQDRLPSIGPPAAAETAMPITR